MAQQQLDQRTSKVARAMAPPHITRDGPSEMNNYGGLLDVHVTPGPRTDRSGTTSEGGTSAFNFPLVDHGAEHRGLRALRTEFVTLCRHLIRPFLMVHEIKGSDREMRRHPSLHGKAPDGRVTRFFLWRKWTLIVIMIQMLAQFAIEIRNFAIFMEDPFQASCPVRLEVDAMKAEAAAAKASGKGGKSSSSTSSQAIAGIEHYLLSPNSTAHSIWNATFNSSIPPIHFGGGGFGFGRHRTPVNATANNATANNATTATTPMTPLPSVVNASIDTAGNIVTDTPPPPPPPPLGAAVPPPPPPPPAIGNATSGARGGKRTLAAEEDGDAPSSSSRANNNNNSTGGTTARARGLCLVCDDISAITGSSPFCYRYFATPGWNSLIRARNLNEARVGSLGLRSLNGTKPLVLNYVCNGTVVGEKTTECFEDKKLLIRRNCSVGFWADEYVEARVYALLGRVMYAPDAAMHWGDCDAKTHLQKRDPVCLVDNRVVNRTYCEIGNVVGPVEERPCCTSSEDIYDTVYNPDYYRVQIFFDGAWLVASLGRVVGTYLAIRWIDNYGMSANAMRFVWAAPFIQAILKYSLPLVSFVGPTSRQKAIEYLTTVTSIDYINGTELNQVMSDSGLDGVGYDVVSLYVGNLINTLRSYIAYNQAWALVVVEFFYRFMYAVFVFGEIGPLATSILPAFRSSSIVLKTLLPQSSMLGWFVTLAPLIYIPFIIAGLSAGVQVFADDWFTIASAIYAFSVFLQIAFFVRNSSIYRDPETFRNQLVKQEYLRSFFVCLSISLFIVFVVINARHQTDGSDVQGTLAQIGFVGALSFILRFIFNFQLSVVFTADSTIYVLRKIQKQSRDDDECMDEYEDALAEFDALDVETRGGKGRAAGMLGWMWGGGGRRREEDEDDGLGDRSLTSTMGGGGGGGLPSAAAGGARAVVAH